MSDRLAEVITRFASQRRLQWSDDDISDLAATLHAARAKEPVGRLAEAFSRLGYSLVDVDHAITVINDSHETHVHWATWRREGHGTGEDHEMIGDLAYHEKAIADYARVLNLLAVVRSALEAPSE